MGVLNLAALINLQSISYSIQILPKYQFSLYHTVKTMDYYELYLNSCKQEERDYNVRNDTT